MINDFRGKYLFLSNFYLHTFMMHGREWISSEHAYQALKSEDFGEQEMVRMARTPGEAKRMGRQLKRFDAQEWDEIKVAVMQDVLEHKFADPALKQMLIDTGNEELVEGNWWNDTFWGVCRGVGENNLGKLLMELRTKFNTERLYESNIP